MSREDVDAFRRRAVGERERANSSSGRRQREATMKLAERYEAVADAYERLLRIEEAGR